MTADVWVDLAEAVREKLLLSSEPSHRSAGEYNAMDIARGFAAWAEKTLLNRCLPPTDRLWKYVLRSQQGIAAFNGISNVADVLHLCERLHTGAQPLTPEALVGRVTWIGLLVLCCEVRQALMHADSGPSGVAKALQLPAQRRQLVVLTVLQELHDKKISSTNCFLVVLLELLREN